MWRQTAFTKDREKSQKNQNKDDLLIKLTIFCQKYEFLIAIFLKMCENMNMWVTYHSPFLQKTYDKELYVNIMVICTYVPALTMCGLGAVLAMGSLNSAFCRALKI